MGETTGDRIRRLRNEKGWTQAELGEKVGRGRKAVGSYEDGQPPPGDVLAKMARKFGVTVDYLLYGEQGLYREAFERIEDLVASYRRRLISLDAASEDARRVEDEIARLEKELAEFRKMQNDD